MVRTVRPNARATPSSPIPTSGNAAASTALPHPPNTSQKVPMNTAASFLMGRLPHEPRCRVAVSRMTAATIGGIPMGLQGSLDLNSESAENASTTHGESPTMKLFSIALATALLTMSGAAAAQSASDAQCLILSNAFATGTKDPQQQKA